MIARSTIVAGLAAAGIVTIVAVAVAPGGPAIAAGSAGGRMAQADGPFGCRLRAEKSVAPPRITLGETVSVTLRVGGTCDAVRRASSDIMLTVDTSGSMAGANLDAAKAAATAFLDVIDFGFDQVGIVGFSSESRLLAGLTADRARLDPVIAQLAAAGGTDIAAGVDEARHVFKNPGHRPGTTPVIVVMTDGRNNAGGSIAVLAARLAKNEGARVFTIGFGTDVDAGTLTRMASSPRDYYYAPGREQLVAAYETIARRVSAEVMFTRLVVSDTLAANMRYVADSGDPRPERSDRTLTWDLSFVPPDGATIRFAVEPREVGRWPVSETAFVEGTGPAGDVSQAAFPPAMVEVVAPVPPPTPPPACVCRNVRQRVPPAVITDAVANPDRFYGWLLPLDPGKPPGPANPPRACLTLQNPTVAYHPQFNTPIWRVGCQ